MNVLAFVPAVHGTSPGQRFRIEQWARHLEADGFHFRFVPFETEALHEILYARGAQVSKARRMAAAYMARLGHLQLLRDADVAFIYREAALIGPALVERLVARSGVPIVYDFDDPIWMAYRSPTNGVFSRLKFFGKTAAICRRASIVTVGNRLLADYARQHAASVHVLPSTIDLSEYTVLPRVRATEEAILGWTGSHSTLPFLHTLGPVLNTLAQDRSIRLHVISHVDRVDWPGTPAFNITGRRWRAASEVEDLHEMDIGLAPFPDSGWTPWRCHGKVLQYMAAGIPVIASAIGILPDFIRDGVNGFLIRDPGEWQVKLRLLIDNPDLRATMGAAGRRTIEEQFSSRVWAARLGELFVHVVARGRGAGGEN